MEIKDKEERINSFFAKLDKVLDLTAKQLVERYNFQKTAYAKQFPMVMRSLWLGADKLKADDTIGGRLSTKERSLSALLDWLSASKPC